MSHGLGFVTPPWLQVVFGCPVQQGYGMTENCANATLGLIGDNRAGHVGPPMPTVEVAAPKMAPRQL